MQQQEQSPQSTHLTRPGSMTPPRAWLTGSSGACSADVILVLVLVLVLVGAGWTTGLDGAICFAVARSAENVVKERENEEGVTRYLSCRGNRALLWWVFWRDGPLSEEEGREVLFSSDYGGADL